MNIEKACRTAFQHYQTGDLQQSEKIFRKILEKKPNHTYALHFLGIIYYQQGNYDSSITHIRKELQFSPENADAYNNLGLALMGKGEREEAISCFRKAISLSPHLFNSYYNLANALRDIRRTDEAIMYYRRTLRLKPDLLEAYNNLGVVLQQKGDLDEAINCYLSALRLNPGLAITHNNLGLAMQEKGQPDEAAAYYRKALHLNPHLADAHNNLGNILRKKGLIDEAVMHFLKALQCNPGFADAYTNLANLFHETRQMDKAVDYYRKSIQMKPHDYLAYYNLGMVLQETNRIDEAVNCFRNAIHLKPDFIDAYNNLGLALQERNQLDEAISCFQKILELDPDNAEAHWNRSLVFLLEGDFGRGWKEFEWRLKVKAYRGRNFLQPLWDGSDISGRTVLLHEEQGFGDTLQFIRFAPLVAQQGAHVIVECQQALVPLIKNIEGVREVIAIGNPLPEFHIHCPLLSLPLAFNTSVETVPAKIPYITVDALQEKKWHDRISHEHADFKIGLVWDVDRTHKVQNRSCPLALFAPLAMLDNITFYSLQKGDGAEQAKSPPEGMRILDFTNEINDFSDTAAIIANLDLVISVDTAAAHVAGALGKPVWTLLPFAPAWRWMVEREDSPWYPTMRLFRQTSPGNWEDVIRKVSEELGKFSIHEHS